jgi:hypothetical protein
MRSKAGTGIALARLRQRQFPFEETNCMPQPASRRPAQTPVGNRLPARLIERGRTEAASAADDAIGRICDLFERTASVVDGVGGPGARTWSARLRRAAQRTNARKGEQVVDELVALALRYPRLVVVGAASAAAVVATMALAELERQQPTADVR